MQAGDGTSGKVWLRDDKGNISLQRLFHKQQRSIEYAPSDLRSLGRYPEWKHRAQLVGPGLLSRLTKTDMVTVQGYKAERYQGQLNGMDIEILWLAEYRLPALVRRVVADREVSIHLLELHPLESAPWQAKDVSNYQTMDFADMGDNEADAFIAGLSHQSTGQHGSHAH